MSLVDEFLGAWNRQDGGAVADLFTADGVYADTSLNETVSGHDGIKEFVVGAFANYSSDMTFEKGLAVETPDGYAVEWIMRGTHDRASEQFPRTDKPFVVPGVSIGAVREGKITRNTDYWSLATLLMQLGLMPAPEGATA